MVSTSYYNNIRKLPKDAVLISVSNSSPHWAELDGDLPSLAPEWSKVEKLKGGLCTEEEFEEYYINNVLSKKDVHAVYKLLNKLGDNVILLCHESVGFCHRHIIAKWFRDAWYIVNEWEN